MQINDANGQSTHVDGNGDMHVNAITEAQFTAAALKHGAYNINTGLIALTGSSESAVLYFKNDESPDGGESRIVIEAFALYVGTRSVTVTDDPLWTILRNPNGGDIISDASAVSINSNADFSTNKTLGANSNAFKGKNGGTITATDGEHAILAGSGRIYAGLPIVLGRGNTVGIKVDLNTSGGANVYAALILRKLDGNST